MHPRSRSPRATGNVAGPAANLQRLQDTLFHQYARVTFSFVSQSGTHANQMVENVVDKRFNVGQVDR